MISLSLENTIEILKNYLKDIWGIKINYIKKSVCSGSIPIKFRKKDKKEYHTFATLKADVELNECSIISISDLANKMKNIEKLTGWECNGFTISEDNKNSITLRFYNYYYLTR